MKTRNGSTKFLVIPDSKLEPDLLLVSPAIIRKLDNGKWVVDTVTCLSVGQGLELTGSMGISWDMMDVETEEGDEEFESPEDAFDSLMDMYNS